MLALQHDAASALLQRASLAEAAVRAHAEAASRAAELAAHPGCKPEAGEHDTCACVGGHSGLGGGMRGAG